MARPFLQYFVAAAFVLMAMAFGETARAQQVRIAIEERWTNIESGKDATVHLAVQSPRPFDGTLSWTVSVGRAPVARGESVIVAGVPNKIAVKIPAQTVKPGVVLEATLAATAVQKGDAAATSTFVQPFWILPPDPFADRRHWAKSLKVILYDPKGTTAAVLKRADFPFEEQPNLAALAEVKDGLLLVGEGLSWREEAGLAETVVKLADRGLTVVCLAPAEGSIAIPGVGQAAGNNVASVTLKRTDAIADLDKRFDAVSWQGNPSIVSGLSFIGEGGDVIGVVGEQGWPWVAVRFAGGGRLIVCGFGVVRHWDAGPTPRYVFQRILEDLTVLPAKKERP